VISSTTRTGSIERMSGYSSRRRLIAFSAVETETPASSAIAGIDQPWATRVSISVSRRFCSAAESFFPFARFFGTFAAARSSIEPEPSRDRFEVDPRRPFAGCFFAATARSVPPTTAEGPAEAGPSNTPGAAGRAGRGDYPARRTGSFIPSSFQTRSPVAPSRC
jgi:hypothetical protein